jgi:hypothetical protein
MFQPKVQSSKFKVLKNIGIYSLLLAIKESYLFSKNLLGLIFHPFKTLRAIERERDYSQAFLLFGLPFYILILGTIAIFSARYLIQAPPEWGILMKTSLLLVFSLAFIVLTYLLYWIYKVRKVR